MVHRIRLAVIGVLCALSLACSAATPTWLSTSTSTTIPTSTRPPLLTPTLYHPTPTAPGDGVAAAENLLLNPGFEDDLDGWYNLGDPPGATAQIDTAVAHSGSKSLRITFDGSADVDYWHVGQDVSVEPNTTYRLQGYLRVSDIRAFSSVGIAVRDGRENGWEVLYTKTADLYATQDWTLVSVTFTTLTDTSTVLVLVSRGGMGGGFPISGVAWVDDVTLLRLPPLIAPSTLALRVGDTQEVVVSNGTPPFVWVSSNPTVATVQTAGDTTRAQVVAQSAGEASITAVDAVDRTGLLTLTAIAQSAITVNADHALREVPEAMFGSNVLYNFTSRYIPDWPTLDLVLNDPVFLGDVAELGLTSLRFPGGMESNYYDFSLEKGWISWMGGAGQYHIEEGITTAQFIQFLRDTDIPGAVITANVYKSGNKLWPEDNWISPQVAADWVDYTNHTLGFYVEYWELGNEVSASDEFPWAGDPQEQGLQVPGLTRDMYIQKIREWSQAMKAVDPTIKIGAVALEAPRGGGVAEWWTLPILQDRADDIDFLIIHPYVDAAPYMIGGEIGDRTASDIYAWIWATDPIARLRSRINTAVPTRAASMEIQATEWDVYTEESVSYGNDTLFKAVMDTDLLWDLIQEGADGANLWTLCSGRTATLEPLSGGRKFAQYYMLWMNRHRSGRWLVESQVSAPTYSAGPFGSTATFDYVEAVDGVPYLSAYATLSDDGNRLYLIVTNKSAESQATTITLNGFTPQGPASVWQMTSAHWDDTGVQPVTSAIAAAATFTYTFPARSVTSFVFQTSASTTCLPLVQRVSAHEFTLPPQTPTFPGSEFYPALLCQPGDSGP
jgi:alpha-L-arabinofuranosidase